NDSNWGNAAFAGVNAAAATYAVIAFMGVKNSIVDTWLGFIEHLYVTDKPAKSTANASLHSTSKRRRRPKAVIQPPHWEDVLYRGVAGTASGQPSADGSGAFRILATPPEAPPTHNRRLTDRTPLDRDPLLERRDRRASDRAANRAATRAEKPFEPDPR
ncbi:MAG: hypothetical protein JWO63_3291, partial [Frankiales bacterium]|nr:hypothetical protein [Frankiales bacterium]